MHHNQCRKQQVEGSLALCDEHVRCRERAAARPPRGLPKQRPRLLAGCDAGGAAAAAPHAARQARLQRQPLLWSACSPRLHSSYRSAVEILIPQRCPTLHSVHGGISSQNLHAYMWSCLGRRIAMLCTAALRISI